VTLTVDAPEPAAAAQRVMLFRVLQEALLNARKHAHATTVHVSFTRAPGAAVLAVRDDGAGFDAAAVPRGHLGLVYMRERAEACDARLEVRSSPGLGTEIRVSVPVS
jgi:signal transduction histidine kinase